MAPSFRRIRSSIRSQQPVIDPATLTIEMTRKWTTDPIDFNVGDKVKITSSGETGVVANVMSRFATVTMDATKATKHVPERVLQKIS